MLCKQAILILLIVVFSINEVCAEYEIKGRLNLSSDWQHQIFLAAINKLDDYYNADPADIIKVGSIEADGTFSLSGNNLPLESRFYRLYMVKEENSEFDACFYADGEDHNFIHLILDNNTKIEVVSDPDHFAPFANYDLIGDEANESLRDLSLMIFPSFYFYQIKFPSELQFSEQKLNRDLFTFADSTKHILVALAAMINTDMDQYFDIDSGKYLDFGERLNSELNNHSYSADYYRKMNYYNGGTTNSDLPVWVMFVISILALCLLMAIIKIIDLQRKISHNSNTPDPIKSIDLPSFTKQEEKILALILKEKSNKEIASELFIELSTVKTHINKLYSKLGAKNRSEAKSLARKIYPVS